MFIWHLWTMSRNPALYSSPESFNPSRFLNPASPAYKSPLTQYPSLQQDAAFGFGRRACPGMQQAEDMLLAAVVGIAGSLELRRKRRADGKYERLPWMEYVGGMATKPVGFGIEVVPWKRYAQG